MKCEYTPKSPGDGIQVGDFFGVNRERLVALVVDGRTVPLYPRTARAIATQLATWANIVESNP